MKELKNIQLSLGCGRKKEEGYIGLDKSDFGWNIVWDAETMTLPFGNESVDFIKANNFFEHISQEAAIKIMNDCNRVLKTESVMEIILPDMRNIVSTVKDPTHKTMWVKETFEYYDIKNNDKNYDYGIVPWKIEECENIPKHTTSLKVIMRKI